MVQPSIQKQLDDYVIQKRLASALFGDVLLCHYKPTDEQVAVKRVLLSAAARRQTLISKKKVRENVALERQLYHLFNKCGGHPNVLAMRDEIEADGYLYMIFDYCARGELYDIVSQADDNDGHLDVATTKNYVRQIANGVAFMHANGYAHRDLSLENVLITSDNVCKVCDFGLAAPANTPSMETVGKMFYMAPEVLSGVMYNPMKADVWSLGVMLFIMLVGAPPVETASTSDARFRLISSKGMRHLIDRWGLSDELPHAAIDLLAKMMDVDPEARISMEQVLSHPFLQLEKSTDEKLVATSPVPAASSSSTATSTTSSNGRISSAIQRLFRRRSTKRVMAVPAAATACKAAIAA